MSNNQNIAGEIDGVTYMEGEHSPIDRVTEDDLKKECRTGHCTEDTEHHVSYCIHNKAKQQFALVWDAAGTSEEGVDLVLAITEASSKEEATQIFLLDGIAIQTDIDSGQLEVVTSNVAIISQK